VSNVIDLDSRRPGGRIVIDSGIVKTPDHPLFGRKVWVLDWEEPEGTCNVGIFSSRAEALSAALEWQLPVRDLTNEGAA
jgi:hypothetical protein